MNAQPSPVRFCDLVMKGGITSGIVYPRVVTEVAKEFTLKNVGGTSAGAIAAAAAAAAEFGRQVGTRTGGFNLLDELPDFLSRTNRNGKSNLFTLFQPQPTTRRLFKVATAALNCTAKSTITSRILSAAIGTYWVAFLLGCLPGIALTMLAALTTGAILPQIVFILVSLGIGLLGGVIGSTTNFFLDFRRAVPRNFYGLCSGMATDSGASTQPALTAWLHSYLNELAGLDPNGPPLTFGQLWDPGVARGQVPRTEDRMVNLEMMTTCVTWGRPFRLPFQDEESVRNNRFYFRKDEFARLFPASVVDWLERNPRESGLPKQWRDQGYVPLPEPWNLPVVIATRMSLSFPVLLSAIPLYSYPQRASEEVRQENPPRPCWFSDGGICSNFPMHFFDSPIPRWPTFAINLVEKPIGTPRNLLAVPWMPSSNNEGIAEKWDKLDEQAGFASIGKFIGSIIGTMQNWSDNTLSHLPGYRDRIAHVALTPGEGGLNLDMPAPLIQELCDRGTAAGKEFVRRFATQEEPVMTWSNHRWLRLRSIMASLEGLVLRIERSCANPRPPDIGYQQWLESTGVGHAPSYQWVDESQRQLAIEVLKRLREIASVVQSGTATLETKAPRPRPELRPRPRL